MLQRTLLIASVLLLFVILFPPWSSFNTYPETGARFGMKPIGFHPIWQPPTTENEHDYTSVQINMSLLTIEMLAALIIAILLAFVPWQSILFRRAILIAAIFFIPIVLFPPIAAHPFPDLDFTSLGNAVINGLSINYSQLAFEMFGALVLAMILAFSSKPKVP